MSRIDFWSCICAVAGCIALISFGMWPDIAIGVWWAIFFYAGWRFLTVKP